MTDLHINNELLSEIKRLSKSDNMTQNDFINMLLSTALAEYKHERSGGAIVTLPNPQFFHINKDKAKETLEALKTATKSIYDLKSNIPFGLYSIIAYFEARLFIDDEDAKKRFRDKLCEDSNAGQRLNNNQENI